MKSKASAVWTGGLKDGKGTISADSGVLTNTPYSFGTRFEGQKGTNPEELIAAAHAACYAMALSLFLGNAGMKPEKLEVSSTVTLEQVEGAFTVTSSELSLTAKVPGAEQAAFEKAAEEAKNGCPISRLLNTKISLTSKLEA